MPLDPASQPASQPISSRKLPVSGIAPALHISVVSWAQVIDRDVDIARGR